MSANTPAPLGIEEALLSAANASRGHFVFESGHHGDLWLDLDAMLVDSRRVREWTAILARQAAACRPEVVCGPMTGGALVAQFLAVELGTDFVIAERFYAKPATVRYAVPESLRRGLSEKRVLLVDDAINAGSALLATLADVTACGGRLAGIASLLSLGEAAEKIAARHEVALFTLAKIQHEIWPPTECPLCRSGVP